MFTVVKGPVRVTKPMNLRWLRLIFLIACSAGLAARGRAAETPAAAAALRVALGRIVQVMLEVIAGRRRAGQLGALAEAIARDFGSVARWRAEFVAMGKALGGGSGWVVLTRAPRDGRLVNVWSADHTNSLGRSLPGYP